jgi:hypothetical protein
MKFQIIAHLVAQQAAVFGDPYTEDPGGIASE